MLNMGVVVGGINGNSKLVSESGLYALVLKSRKPEAQTFRKWVPSVVLPAWRWFREMGRVSLPRGTFRYDQGLLAVLATPGVLHRKLAVFYRFRAYL